MQYQSSFNSLLGFLILKSDGHSLTGRAFSENELHEQNDSAVLLKCKQQLDDYFSGKTLVFDLPLSTEGTEFQQKVWNQCAFRYIKFICNMKNLTYEACVETLEDAIIADENGANRIELCSALDHGGLTPSQELTAQCIYYLSIPVMAMVRPRGGDFVYSEVEIIQMEAEIEFFKQSGVTGVVFWLLTDKGKIDVENTRRLAKLAFPLEVTFHKAIDYSTDVMRSFQELNAIDGITRVLTSGGMDTAWNGRSYGVTWKTDLPYWVSGSTNSLDFRKQIM